MTRPETLAKILEETPGKETGGHYGAVTLGFDAVVNNNEWKSYDFTLDIDIAILSSSLVPKGVNDGDLISVEIAPESAVGTLAQSVAVGLTTIPVPQSVIDLFENGTLRIGCLFILDDATNKNELGVVKSYDENALTVEVQTATVNSFGVGTTIKVTMTMTPPIAGTGNGHIELKASETAVRFGDDKIGSTYVAAGKVIRIRYKNIGGVTVRVVPLFHFLY